MTRDYYNRRTGVDGGRPKLTLEEVAAYVADAYRFIDDRGYVQRSFGYHCVDDGDVPGRDGNGIRQGLLLATGLRCPTSLDDFLRVADEASLFTVIEFIFDHVAKPREGSGHYHSFNSCGWHYGVGDARLFDEAAARTEWRSTVNGTLKFYEAGFELSAAGEIVRLTPDGVASLVQSPLPTEVQPTDVEKVAHAVRTFHLGRATREERKQAVRALFDVLEYHRPTLKGLLAKDEHDLFNIANNFSIRHHRDNQKDDYDDAWLAWMFYVNLATVHLVLGRVHGATSFGADVTTNRSATGKLAF